MSNEYKTTLKSANGIVVFLLELAMLAAFGYFGYKQPANIGLRIGFAAGLVVAAIILWATFAAPKSGKRLRLPSLAAFRVSMFLLAAFLVYRLGHKNWAIGFAATALITQTISCFIGD